jgi:hypothetical protein
MRVGLLRLAPRIDTLERATEEALFIAVRCSSPVAFVVGRCFCLEAEARPVLAAPILPSH